MAEILEFRAADLKRNDGGQAAGARGPAEVVVFPGVRYERWDEVADAAKDSATSAPRLRRDVIELAE